MTYEFKSGTYRQTNLPNESEEYLAKREELRLTEIELMEHRERLAAQRRALPQGAALQDYEFLEGPGSLDANHEPVHTVKLSNFSRRPAAGDLPLDVQQEAGQALPDVHDVDRWSQRWIFTQVIRSSAASRRIADRRADSCRQDQTSTKSAPALHVPRNPSPAIQRPYPSGRP